MNSATIMTQLLTLSPFTTSRISPTLPLCPPLFHRHHPLCTLLISYTMRWRCFQRQDGARFRALQCLEFVIFGRCCYQTDAAFRAGLLRGGMSTRVPRYSAHFFPDPMPVTGPCNKNCGEKKATKGFQKDNNDLLTAITN